MRNDVELLYDLHFIVIAGTFLYSTYPLFMKYFFSIDLYAVEAVLKFLNLSLGKLDCHRFQTAYLQSYADCCMLSEVTTDYHRLPQTVAMYRRWLQNTADCCKIVADFRNMLHSL